jgi:hypothetical protein
MTMSLFTNFIKCQETCIKNNISRDHPSLREGTKALTLSLLCSEQSQTEIPQRKRCISRRNGLDTCGIAAILVRYKS